LVAIIGGFAMSEAFYLLGQPRFGGIMIVSDHASNRVPDGVSLGVAPEVMGEHVAVDIGVGAVAANMARRPGIAAFCGHVSRLVCDLNRDEHWLSAIPEVSDGLEIPGNRLDAGGREARLAAFHRPYHEALAALLDEVPPALILSLHSFTPRLATCDKPRPWHIGILYNQDDRAARIAIPLLEAQGLCVGDQLPYSGRELNYSMDRHAEGEGRPYLGVEIRQDLISDPAGQEEWAQRLGDLCNKVALALG
jgi:predicted N-formylglutamate amidohydrolase